MPSRRPSGLPVGVLQRVERIDHLSADEEMIRRAQED